MTERQNKLYKEFIRKSIEKFGDKYDYSNITNYTTNKTKVEIYCKIHDHTFYTEPKRHYIEGKGCEFCSGYKWNKEIFIEKARGIHGDKYDYSLVNYTNNDTKVSIICSDHGIFEMSPGSHTINKNKCMNCYLDNLYQKSVKNKSDFEMYKHLVEKVTNKNYRLYKGIINPNNYKRGYRDYHIDHKFSIFEGFLNCILPSVMGSIYNLEMIKYDDNIRKSKKSTITLENILTFVT